MKTLFAGFSALALIAAASSAFAAGGNASQGLTDLQDLNLIVFGDVTGGGQDTEGKAFIGGNLGNGTFNIASAHGYTEASSSFATLTVGGNQTGNININNFNSAAGGALGAKIGGNAGTVSINGTPSDLEVGGSVDNYNANGQTYNKNLGSNFKSGITNQTATFVSDLKALSSALGALAQTTGSSYSNPDQNTNNFIAKDGGKGYAIITITAAQMASANNFTYSLASVAGGGYIPTVINVTGVGANGLTVKANSNNSAYDQYVLFNYVDAQNITFQNQVSGSVLAPLANISNSSPLEGSVVAANFAQNGEVHIANFLGQAVVAGHDPSQGLRGAVGGGNISAVPEPAAWAMMILGVGFMGASLRRRRSLALAA